jgi:hypothetical protein
MEKPAAVRPADEVTTIGRVFGTPLVVTVLVRRWLDVQRLPLFRERTETWASTSCPAASR